MGPGPWLRLSAACSGSSAAAWLVCRLRVSVFSHWLPHTSSLTLMDDGLRRLLPFARLHLFQLALMDLPPPLLSGNGCSCNCGAALVHASLSRSRPHRSFLTAAVMRPPRGFDGGPQRAATRRKGTVSTLDRVQLRPRSALTLAIPSLVSWLRLGSV